MIQKYLQFAALVILVCANLLLSWSWWQSVTLLEEAVATVETCRADVVRLTTAASPVDDGETAAFIAQVPVGWGLPHTCIIGELARDWNHPHALYLCVAKDRWQGFPFQRLPPPAAQP